MDETTVTVAIPMPILKAMYFAMIDSKDRLTSGTVLLTYCIGWLESERNFKKPEQTKKESEKP